MSMGGATVDTLTGRECIRGALALNGLDRVKEREAFDEIIEFCGAG